MKKTCIFCLIFLPLAAAAQMPDTTGIYGERRDSLDAAVSVSRQAGNYVPRGKDIKAEIISSAGLCKMACCNLAESFENSAGITVGYSDAVTGARQIRLLGQSGIYTQMLDENRPVMRGLSAPFGLSYVPGQWLESIQIAKGVTSVINGVESMTGQINMEHRKPTDEKPLYLQASLMGDGKADLNVASSLQLDDEGKWSTVILGHVDGLSREMDSNADGFLDDPLSLQMNLSNRWLYFDPSGLQVRFGVSALQDERHGGQVSSVASPWTTDIRNRSLDAYLKVGMPIDEDQNSSVALVADVCRQGMEGAFGLTNYNATQTSAFFNILLQKEINESHKFTAGFSDTFDRFFEFYERTLPYAPGASLEKTTDLNDFGLFGEYTYHAGDKFSAILGLRADWYKGYGFSPRISPRITMKWAPTEDLVFRGNLGRGIRASNPLTDNIGVLSSSKVISGDVLSHNLEDAWTEGISATYYFPFAEGSSSFLGLEYFHTSISDQLGLDYSATGITFYETDSYTDTWQADLSVEPVERLTVTLTGRFTDARQNFFTLPESRYLEKPMMSRYKAVANLQYATNLNRWIFDFTASLNGPCKVWSFMETMYPGGYTPAYPLLYAQVTKRFKGFDIYAGGENLANYRQENPIISADDPSSPNFDASLVWGPLMGIRVYAGIRITIWK